MSNLILGKFALEHLYYSTLPYSFGVLKAMQTLGDMQSLSSRHRRVIRLHLEADVENGLARLEQLIEASIGSHAH